MKNISIHMIVINYLMLDLLKQHKFPKRLHCTRFNDQTIAILLNHAVAQFINKEDAKEFIDLLWGEVENGNISPNIYALTRDHYVNSFIDPNLSYFGTFATIVSGEEGYYTQDVLDPEHLNELRKKYWLLSIEESCKRRNFKLPPNYKSGS